MLPPLLHPQSLLLLLLLQEWLSPLPLLQGWQTWTAACPRRRQACRRGCRLPPSQLLRRPCLAQATSPCALPRPPLRRWQRRRHRRRAAPPASFLCLTAPPSQRSMPVAATAAGDSGAAARTIGVQLVWDSCKTCSTERAQQAGAGHVWRCEPPWSGIRRTEKLIPAQTSARGGGKGRGKGSKGGAPEGSGGGRRRPSKLHTKCGGPDGC